LALNAGSARAGLALERSSEDQTGLSVQDVFGGNDAVAKLASDKATDSVAKSVSAAKTTLGSEASPGLTGENWFKGLQQGVDHAFDLQDDGATPATPAHKEAVSALDNGVKANAIPSLPSFWSGLTCCLALTVAGFFPRVRRAFR
jgi:hypothetical protein